MAEAGKPDGHSRRRPPGRDRLPYNLSAQGPRIIPINAAPWLGNLTPIQRISRASPLGEGGAFACQNTGVSSVDRGFWEFRQSGPLSRGLFARPHDEGAADVQRVEIIGGQGPSRFRMLVRSRATASRSEFLSETIRVSETPNRPSRAASGIAFLPSD